MEVAPQDVTHLLLAWSDGDPAALEKLVPLVRARLRHLARRYMRDERRGHILQTTALINEAYLRLIDWKHVSWKNRAHFFGVSAELMRHILVDLARQRPRVKGGAEARHCPLDEALVMCKERSRDLVAVDDALKALSVLDAQKGRVVELRFFGGLSVEETAEVLDVAPITVKREWKRARLWLYRELRRGKGHEA